MIISLNYSVTYNEAAVEYGHIVQRDGHSVRVDGTRAVMAWGSADVVLTPELLQGTFQSLPLLPGERAEAFLIVETDRNEMIQSWRLCRVQKNVVAL